MGIKGEGIHRCNDGYYLTTEKGRYKKYLYSSWIPCYVRKINPDIPLSEIPATWLENFMSHFSDLNYYPDLDRKALRLCYENDVAKYNIPVEYIIRREYDEEKDIYEEEIEEEIVEEEIVEEEEEKSVSKNIRDEYIDRLKNGRGKSREWSHGMSKYSSVSYNSTIDKWCWNSNIFNGNITYFKNKNEAENHYEKILDKYNIPVEYIIRRGYNKDKDED